MFFSWTFDLLLILIFSVYFSPHQRNIACDYKLSETSHDIKTNIFACFWYWCWKKLFLNVKLKKKNSLWINFNFSQFHKHIFRSSHSQMLFKIGALKNFAILRIKKRLQLRSSHLEVFLKKVFVFASWC